MDSVLQAIRWIFILGCVIPSLVLLVIGVLGFWFGRRWLQNFVEPDVEKIQSEFTAMKAQNPDLQHEKLLEKVVHRQSVRCGMVGALTGLGGFVTLPIALPIDIVLSSQIQASMVSFIAQSYGYSNSIENKAATYAVMTGSNELAALSNKMIVRYAPKLLGKSFAKLVPILGSAIGFALNYTIAQSTARVAVKWYEGKSRQEILTAGQEELGATA